MVEGELVVNSVPAVVAVVMGNPVDRDFAGPRLAVHEIDLASRSAKVKEVEVSLDCYSYWKMPGAWTPTAYLMHFLGPLQG